MRPRILGVRSRFVLFVAAGVGLVSAVMAGVTFWEASSSLLASRQEQLFALAEGKAAELGRQLAEVSGPAQGLANNLEVTPRPDHPVLTELITKGLVSTRRMYGLGVAYAPRVYDPARRLFAVYLHRSAQGIRAADIASREYNYPRHDWYLIPQLLARSIWTEPYFGQGGGVVMTTYCAPVVDKGRVLAIVAADISLAELGREVARMAVGQRGYAFLLSRHGTFLAAPREEWVMRETIFSLAEEQRRPGLRDLGQRLVRGGAGLEPVRDWHLQEQVWLAFAPVAEVGWSLGVVVPQDEVLAPAWELARKEGLAAAVGLAALVAVVWLMVLALTRPLSRLAAGARRLASGDLTTKVEGIRPGDEVGELAGAFNSMVDDLNRYVDELTATTAAKERIESELDLARQIQQSILPRTYPPFPERPDFDLFAKALPAREVGGDFYDFFFIDDQRLGLVLGDVSGKGVPAALFMTVSRTLIKNAATHHPDPAQAIAEVNSQILPDNEMCMFVTVFYGVYHTGTGVLRYVCAGHPAPLIRRAGGEAEQLPGPGGMAVGVFEELGLAAGEVQLEVGDTIVVFTDGLDEAVNHDNEAFGLERAKQWLAQTPPASAPEMIEALLAAHHDFTGECEQFDDLTLLVFRRTE
jgi:sigma-B regulation protein RsbU (phosphoserine phosphatase)